MPFNFFKITGHKGKGYFAGSWLSLSERPENSTPPPPHQNFWFCVKSLCSRY